MRPRGFRRLSCTRFSIVLGAVTAFIVLLSHYYNRSVDQDRLDNSFVRSLNYGDENKAWSLLLDGASPNAYLTIPSQHIGVWQRLKLMFGGRDASARGSSALMIASGQEMRHMVAALLERGADVHARTSDGETALSSACRQPDADIVKSLLENHSDPNTFDIEGATPLHMAVAYCNASVVHALLDGGADPRALDRLGKTPVKWATEYGCGRDVFEILAKYSDHP